jgi:hypothetical protein
VVIQVHQPAPPLHQLIRLIAAGGGGRPGQFYERGHARSNEELVANLKRNGAIRR